METYRSKFWLVLLLVVLLFFVGGCAPETTPDVTTETPDEVPDEVLDEPNILVIGIPGDVETVDPGFGAHQRTNETLKNIYDQWVQYNRQDTGEGYYIADTTDFLGKTVERFEFSDDMLEVKLKIREGMTFINTDNEVTADDFYYKLERAFGLQASEQWVFNTAGIFNMDQVTVDDKYNLTITFEQPAPLFLPLMRDQCTGIIDSIEIEKHATDDDPWATKWLARNYAGSGPYYVERWDVGVEMVLAAKENYWGGKPYFDKVILKVIPESTNRVLMLKEGSIDIASELSPEELESLKGVPGVNVFSIPSTEQYVLGINFDHEPFDNIKLRQALAYAIPYDDIVDGVFRGDAKKGSGPMSALSAYYDLFGLDDFDMYYYDPDKAKELMAEAGYPEGGVGFTLAIQSGISVAEELAVLVKDSFQKIGVEVTIDKQAAAVFAEGMGKKDQEAFIRDSGAWVDDPYYTYFLFYETGTIINWTNYSNPRVDEIIEMTRYMTDNDERRPLYREAVQLTIEECAQFYLVEQNFMVATRDDIVGFVQEPDYLWTYSTIKRVE